MTSTRRELREAAGASVTVAGLVIGELDERVREQAGGRLPSYDGRGRLCRR